MAFDFPSVATEKKLAKKKAKEAKENKDQEDYSKVAAPVEEKKGIKGEIAKMQLEDALTRTKGSFDKIIKDKAKLKKVVDAAADDKQLERSERSILRHYKSGGRAGYSVGGKAIKGVSNILIKK